MIIVCPSSIAQSLNGGWIGAYGQYVMFKLQTICFKTQEELDIPIIVSVSVLQGL